MIKNKIRIFFTSAILLSLINIYCYRAHFEDHMKLRDYTASEQLLYNPSFEAEEYAADALIREIVRGKKVVVPRELTPYSGYSSYGHMHDEGNPFSDGYFRDNNYTKYFMEYASVVTVDTSLPDLYVIEKKPLPEAVQADLTCLGPGNDMMRYVFMADHTDEETSNQFFYTWFYTVEPPYQAGEDLTVNICTDNITEDDTLVALWDTGENLYLMSRTYYDEMVAPEYQNALTGRHILKKGRENPV